MSKEKILITGGLGFIGSHTAIELINCGYEVIIVDNLANSDRLVLHRIEHITGKKPEFYQLDLLDKSCLQELFRVHKDIKIVNHFAACKSVRESLIQPIKCFNNNIISLLNLIDVMEQEDCLKIVFSSSANVYGQPDRLPIKESAPFKKASSAYGSSKQVGEDILEKVSASGKINSIALRYFTPVGAHPTGLMGEIPRGVPNGLMPFITQTAIGKREVLTIFGNDFSTSDGTAIRDYIHVVDIAKAHVLASGHLLENKAGKKFEVFNIGTGKGSSVQEVVETFEKINHVEVEYVYGERREGDVEKKYADVSKANEQLGWCAKLTLEDMVRDAWKWEKSI
jgi:UDP-glucose 4-epimerase